jgi:hypothetical protein
MKPHCMTNRIIFLALAACSSPPPEPPGGPYAGFVTFIWAPSSNGVLANFTTPQSATSPFACPGTQVGNCCSYAQPIIANSPAGAEPVPVGAGRITLTDGAQRIGSFDFSGFGYVPLSSAETASLTWAPGDTLQASASGGNVDAFSGSITAPPAFDGVSPAMTTDAMLSVKLANDFTVSWSPGTSPQPVTLVLFDVAGFYVACSGPDSAGSLTAPSATMSSFASDDTGYITLTRSADQSLQVFNATVTLTAEATAVGAAVFH